MASPLSRGTLHLLCRHHPSFSAHLRYTARGGPLPPQSQATQSPSSRCQQMPTTGVLYHLDGTKCGTEGPLWTKRRSKKTNTASQRNGGSEQIFCIFLLKITHRRKPVKRHSGKCTNIFRPLNFVILITQGRLDQTFPGIFSISYD